jgi:hypothetical protein
MPTKSRRNMVVAREAIVINVGGRPPQYERVTVIDRKSGQQVEINKDDPYDEGDLGVPYAFKANEKVSRNHPAVKECPGAFMSLEEAEDEGDE